MKIWLLLLTMIAEVGFGQDPQFVAYEIRNYPIPLSDCQYIAPQLVQKFQGAYQIQVFSWTCRNDNLGGTNLTLYYPKTDNFYRVTTADEVQPWSLSPGLYLDLTTCQRYMPMELQNYKQQTGIDPYLNYCARVESLSQTQYIAVVDGFTRDITKRPLRFESPLYGVVVEYQPGSIQQRIFDAASAAVEGVHMALITGDSGRQLIVRYYDDQLEASKYRHPFDGIELGRYLGDFNPPSDLDCTAESRYVQEQLDLARVTNFVPFCSWNKNLNDHTLHVFLAGSSVETLATFPTEIEFNSYDQCVAKRGEVIQQYNSSTSSRVHFAAVCTWRPSPADHRQYSVRPTLLYLR
jgi:hypothetical protein